jgi:hypothetical protein
MLMDIQLQDAFAACPFFVRKSTSFTMEAKAYGQGKFLKWMRADRGANVVFTFFVYPVLTFGYNHFKSSG